jgi:hypothetical protein
MHLCLFLAPILFKIGVLVWIIWLTRDLGRFAQAIIGGGTQFVALLVLVIGCVMVVISKKYGIDTTISGGIIGVGGNMLTGHAQQKLSDSAKTNPSGPAVPATETSSPNAS